MISQDKEKRLEYEAREKAIRDYNQCMKEAQKTGWEAGRQTGREEGRIEGEKEGKFIIAKNMLLKNFDISIIAECTGLLEEEIKGL